jgi:HemY protein
MIRTLVYLLALGCMMAGVAWVAARPGEVMIVWEGWRIDANPGVFAAALGVLLIAAAVLTRVWTALITAPRRFARWRRERRARAGYAALSAGLVAVAAGDPAGARREAKRADRLLDGPPLTLLLTAQAAQLAGDEATAHHYFTAMLERPETEFLGLRGLLARAMRDRDLSRALELAKRARGLRPKTPWVLTTLIDLQTRQGDWEGAADTLVQASAAKALPPADLQRHQSAAYLELSRRAAARGADDDALRYAKNAHRADADNAAATAWYADRLVAAGRKRRAAKLIEHEWTRRPHPDFLGAYRQARSPATALAWASEVQRLAALAPAHPDSHRALGDAALEAGLWGEARKHYTAAIAAAGATPPAALCRKMADVEDGDGGDPAAARRWLTLAAEGHPDASWLCDVCGTAHATWQPVCRRCAAFDRLQWRIPDRLTLALAKPSEPAAIAGAAPPVP